MNNIYLCIYYINCENVLFLLLSGMILNFIYRFFQEYVMRALITNSFICTNTKNSQMLCNFLPWSQLFLHKYIRCMYNIRYIRIIHIYSLLTFNKRTAIIYYFCHRLNSKMCLMCKAEKSNGRAKTPRPVAPPPPCAV